MSPSQAICFWTLSKTGLELDAGFGALPPVGQSAINNTLIRCGSFGYGQFQPAIIVEGGGTNTTVNNNTISNSMFGGVEIQGIGNLLLESNLITAPGTTGITIDSGYSGSGNLDYNTTRKSEPGPDGHLSTPPPQHVAATPVGNIFQSNVGEVSTAQSTPSTLGRPASHWRSGTFPGDLAAAKGMPNHWASSVLIPGGRMVIAVFG